MRRARDTQCRRLFRQSHNVQTFLQCAVTQFIGASTGAPGCVRAECGRPADVARACELDVLAVGRGCSARTPNARGRSSGLVLHCDGVVVARPGQAHLPASGRRHVDVGGPGAVWQRSGDCAGCSLQLCADVQWSVSALGHPEDLVVGAGGLDAASVSVSGAATVSPPSRRVSNRCIVGSPAHRAGFAERRS